MCVSPSGVSVCLYPSSIGVCWCGVCGSTGGAVVVGGSAQGAVFSKEACCVLSRVSQLQGQPMTLFHALLQLVVEQQQTQQGKPGRSPSLA